jgi:diguanylate cyclase (GGDEF)-like protein/PAS domain S-box-containing protein
MALKIRTWVLAAATVVLVPMIAILFAGFRHVQQSERARVEAEVRFQARELVHAANERIAVAVQALQALSFSEAARVSDWKALYDSAKLVAATDLNYEVVTLVDENDNRLFGTGMPYGSKTFAPRQAGLVQEVFRTGLPNVSGPFTVPVAPGKFVAVSVPVFHNGQVTHVLRMVMKAASISQLLDKQQLPPGWIAAIADRDGILLARSIAPEEYVGKKASATFLAAIQRNDGQLYRGRSLEGLANTSLALPIYNGYWFAAVAVPDHVLESEFRAEMEIIGLVALLISVLGVGVAVGIAHFFSRQALALEQAVGSGRPDAPLPSPLHITELQRVYESYSAVSQREQRAQSSLVTVTHEKDEVEDLYDNAPCGYHSLDADGRIVRINQTELRWLGRTREEVVGQPFMRFVTAEGQAQFRAKFPTFLSQGHIENVEFDLVRADGTTFPVSISGTLVLDKDGKPLMSRSTVFDITERKLLEHRLEALSNSDMLTGLSNRRHFYELAANEIERSQRHNTLFALAMLDVDHFKRVNDTHGHAVGDQVLKELSAVCKTELRQVDIIARIGGEEFVILMPQTDHAAAVTVLERLRETIQARTVPSSSGEPVGFTVSIGVAAQRWGETDIDEILARADAALYEAKRLGRNQVRVG